MINLNYMKIKFILLLAALGLLFNSNLVLANNKQILVGPRNNIASSTPTAYGFWSFAIPITNTLARSGQPTIAEFQWLKSQGYKSVINLRFDGEYKEIADDQKLSGFTKLNFNYLRLPIRDGSTPTIKQAETFLKFVQNKTNQPVLIHCRGGYGRTGTMVALYRYEVQSWPMATAIKESQLFHGGVDAAQKKWLVTWAKNHPQK